MGNGERSTDNSQQTTDELSTLILFINVIALIIRLLCSSLISEELFRVQRIEYNCKAFILVILVIRGEKRFDLLIFCQRDNPEICWDF